MSGIRSSTQTRNSYKRNSSAAKSYLDEAVQKYHRVEFVDEDTFGTLDALKSSSKSAIKLGTDVEELYGNEALKLHQCKYIMTFSAKHCDFVTQFEDVAFSSFHRAIPKDMSPILVSAVATKKNVLSTLASLTWAERGMHENDDDKAFVDALGWVKEAWSKAVGARGLSYSDYEVLREFKSKINRTFHDADSPADALRVLESQAQLPDEVQKYKEPLIRLLKLLE